VEESGFRPAVDELKVKAPEISIELIDSLKEIEEVLGLKELMKQIKSFVGSRGKSRVFQKSPWPPEADSKCKFF